MKRKWIAGVGLALCLVMGLCSLPVNELAVTAAEGDYTTVQGTIKKGTTASLLLLNTPQGDMEIKIDSNADLSGCKLLLPGKKVYASLYYGSDAYMHAAKITSAAPVASATVDNSTKATVSGKISEKSTEEILYVATPQGDMEIKLDPSTDMSGVRALTTDRVYNIVCARGSDAYMHAIQITDSGQGTVSGTSVSVSAVPSSINTNGATNNISGTVSSNTTTDILYLNTKDGEMQFKLDSTTDTLYGMVHMPGSPLTVYYKYGNDEYWHATCVVGSRTTSNATVDTSSTSTVTGTVDKKSTESILYLSTIHGMMELKMDSVTSISGCKAMIEGKRVTVTCARGSDAYMHALTITG